MALIKCQECNNAVSTEADFCPHCGYKAKKNTPPPIPTNLSKTTSRKLSDKDRIAISLSIILTVIVLATVILSFIVESHNNKNDNDISTNSVNLESIDWYVTDNTLSVYLEPKNSAKITNKLYKSQKVSVYQMSEGWARISEYYDGDVEGISGKVARWVEIRGLSKLKPNTNSNIIMSTNSRISKDAIPAVGENGLTEDDVQIITKGALKYLNNGICDKIEYGDKSINKKNTYYINCGGQNYFFTKQSVK